jgi:hypothetical protein
MHCRLSLIWQYRQLQVGTDAIHHLGLHVDRHLVGDTNEMTLLPCDVGGRTGHHTELARVAAQRPY